MKKIILIFFLLSFYFSLGLFAQQSILSKYERADINYEGQQYAKLLNIDNKNQLILKLEQEEFIVYEDSAVYRFYIDWDKSLNKKKLSASETLMCYKHLDSLKTINPYNLNVTKQMKMDSLDAIEYTDVQDGISYKLCLFRNDVTVKYETYSPEIYIEQKFPFYKEREKLLNAYKYFNSLFEEAEITRNCGLMNEIIHNPKFLEHFKVDRRHASTIYLLENSLCNLDLKINGKLNIKIIKKEELKKDMTYLSVSSINVQSSFKMITIDYPMKNIVFKVFTLDDKLTDIKILKTQKGN